MAKVVVKKHFDKVTFKWLTDDEYRAIIKKMKLTSSDITERFKTIVMAKSE